MAKKIDPATLPLSGDEVAIVFQNGKAVRTTTQSIADKAPAATGPKGDQGPPGPKGDTGPAGKDGVPGAAGAKGDTGPAGKDGAAGAKGDQGPAGSKGDTGAAGRDGAAGTKGDKGDTGAAGAAGAPKRVDRFSGVTASTGIAPITFSPAFENTPDVDVIEGWSGEQMITGAVVTGSITKTGCQVQVMVSRATLLLSSGPFQKAGSGVLITVRAIGN